jgi:hypothetical protein
VRSVNHVDNRLGRDWFGERRPAGAGLELFPRSKEGVAATGAYVGARILCAQKAPFVWRFGSMFAEHPVLLLGQPLFPFVVAEVEFAVEFVVFHG